MSKDKAVAATELYKSAALSTDYGPVLRVLNQARKDIWYEGEDPELDGDLESLVAQVDDLVRATEASK